MSEVNTPEVKAEAPKLTRAEKLAKRAEFLRDRIESDKIEYNGIANELNNAAALAALKEGDAIQLKLGRKFADKDTTRIVDATIIGSRTEEDGSKQFKVQYGSGFDADVAVVGAGQIILIPAAA